MKISVGSKIGLGFGLGIVFLLVVGIIAYVGLATSTEAIGWVTHTHEVLEDLEHMFGMLKGGAQSRLLVVEDNDVNQKVAMWTLENLGCHVDLTANGEEALSILESVQYDLIFMDCQMPKMDGFRATAEIWRREKRQGGHIPIVGLTSNAMKGDRDRCLEAGMDDYIAKPVRKETLKQALETYGHRRSDEGHKGRDEVFDRDEVLERIGGDRELLKELVTLFHADCWNLLAEIRDAVTREDCEALAMAAHTLKGAVSNFGAADAVEAAQKLESIDCFDNWEAAAQYCSDLDREIERLVPSLVAMGQEEEL
jgi:CheY-like chemotaxis protein/HPt (histidine-containing phosphotransfer) domain-containing protein